MLMSFLAMTPVASAAPSISATFVFTENLGPNPFEGWPQGQVLALGALVSDPLGVPDNIASVLAAPLTAGQPSFTLSFINAGPIFTGLYQVFPWPDYQGEVGRWEITLTNRQGETATATTHALDKPRLIPLAANIRFSDSSSTPVITWDPVLFDDDLNPATPAREVEEYRVRFIRGVDPTAQFFRSDPLRTSSFAVPVGVLTPGELVTVRIEATDLDLDDGSVGENRSSTFVPFNPVLGLSLAANGAAFRTGEALVISVEVNNTGLAATADFAFGALLPDEDTVVFFTDLAFNSGVGRLSNPATLRPIVAGVDLIAPFTFSQPSFFTYRWSGSEPPGRYVLFLSAIRAGSLEDNSIDPGDILALALVEVTFTP